MFMIVHKNSGYINRAHFCCPHLADDFIRRKLVMRKNYLDSQDIEFSELTTD